MNPTQKQFSLNWAASKSKLLSVFFYCAALATLPAAASSAGAPAIPEPSWLRDQLVAVRKKHDLPAISAAVVSHGRIIGASAIGYRKLGDLTQVTVNDTFHLGSIAKPMTATLVGLYMDQGVLKFDTSLAEMFPELVQTMKPAYRTVTVAQLLSHTSGLPYQPKTPEVVTDHRGNSSVSRRYEYVKAALADEPEAAPGTKVIYSGGAIIVASFLERKTGKPYEQSIRERLFMPLGMNTAGFGCMASPGRLDGPWEHVWRKDRFVPVAPEAAQRDQARSPVGRNVFCSVTDLARFAALQLDCEHGRSSFLSQGTIKALHTRIPGGNFGPGFVVDPQTWIGKRTIWHAGSNGKNHATLAIGIERDLAVCVMTNAEGGGATKACDEVQFFVGRYLSTASE